MTGIIVILLIMLNNFIRVRFVYKKVQQTYFLT